jgi:hypothetical protein
LCPSVHNFGLALVFGALGVSIWRSRCVPFRRPPGGAPSPSIKCPWMKGMGDAGDAPCLSGTTAPAVGLSGSGGGLACLRQRGAPDPWHKISI